MGWDNLEGCDGVGGSEVQKGGDICTHPADSLHCKAETDNIVKQFYSNKSNSREPSKVSFQVERAQENK